jgi:sugar lactone lactonase YvrE
MYTIDAPFSQRHDLGEGPHWDAATRRLLYVDIFLGLIHDLDPATSDLSTLAVDPPVGFVVPVRSTQDRICACGGELVLLGADDTESARLPVEADQPGHRINDGKADPVGRLWFGTMGKGWEPLVAALYRLDERGLRVIADGVTLSNGLDWDVERRRMYYVDSATQQIDVFDYDVATGEVENRRPWATIDPADGLPDGLCLDAEGGLWLALFGGGVVRRYDPDGIVIADVAVPVQHPTCPIFGGDDLATLFVTTSRHKLTPGQRDQNPLAGALLVVDAGVRGRPCGVISPTVAAALTYPPKEIS